MFTKYEIYYDQRCSGARMLSPSVSIEGCVPSILLKSVLLELNGVRQACLHCCMQLAMMA